MNQEPLLSKVQAATNLSEPAPLHAVIRAEIDQSLRLPLLLLVRTAAFWFVVGSFLALLSGLKLVLPSFLDGSSFFTYGRLFPVACDLLIYGWATPIGLAVSLWLIARLCGTPLRCSKIFVSAGLIWNLGVFLGSLAVLSGYSTSVEFLEYPQWASFILFVAFVLMGIPILMLFSARQPHALYVSQWYLLAALCSFPWIYATANMLLIWGRIQGSAQGPIHWWYVGNLIGLWLTSLALAVSYYIIPKITGVPVYSYYLAVLGFFSLLFFEAWSGMSFLLGGPIPAWMASGSVVATTLLIIPMIAVVINFYKMLRGHHEEVVQSPALRFVVVGIISYVVVTLLGALNAIPSMNAIFHFTDYTQGMLFLSLLGFFSMTLFGAVYYIMPRLVDITWLSTPLIRWHFWLAVVGVTLLVVSMTLGGLMEGIALNDPVISFVNVLSYAAPWRWLVVLAWGLVLSSGLCFARLMILMRWKIITTNLPLVVSEN